MQNVNNNLKMIFLCMAFWPTQ